MEKRTLMAFVLSFLILILWSVVFGPKSDQVPKPKEPKEKAATEKSVATPTAPKQTAPVAQKAPATKQIEAGPKVDEKKIEIHTPLYRAVISNSGPSITSFKLKRFRQTLNPDAPLIEMVNLKEGTEDFLRIAFERLNSGKNGKITFQADPDVSNLKLNTSPRELVFKGTSPDGLSIRQTYRFYPDQYRIDVKIELANKSANTIKGTVASYLKALPPQDKRSYYSYVGLAILLDQDLKEVEIEEADDSKEFKGRINWIAYEDDYFISAIIPQDPEKGIFRGRMLPSGLLEGRHLPPAISLNPSEQAAPQYTLYIGPRDLETLKHLGKNLERAVNFGWTDIIAKPLLYVLRFFNQYINNYGVSIILLTILVKILFWPLTHKSYKSMKEMQKLQPRIAKLREKYKNNKQEMNKEMMGLYKTYKVNPMGGCLPMIIQIPVFFALFRLLGSAIELRHAPFFLWIKDLSAPDRLFSFPFSIPFMTPPYGIPVLTLLMGASMFIQQKMTPTPGDPTQAKIMMFLPIIFTFLFINFPSGLVLYWLVNNILSIGQQYRIQKRPG
jgi:YidC/Oxa1 family membrane protein insertase